MFSLKCLNDNDEKDSLIKREIDCRTRFILCDSENARKSKWVQREIEYIESQQKPLPYKRFVHTITMDNGVEFMNHKNICKAFECTVFFADPYCTGQKGAIENTNKLLREFFPKVTDFRLVSQTELNKTQYLINDRPRKNRLFNAPKRVLQKN